MEVKFNTEDLIKLGLSPDEYTALQMLNEDFSSTVSLWLNPEKLYTLKYIEIDFEGGVPLLSTAKITDKGREIFGNPKDLMSVEQWIDEWRNLFPEGVKQAGGPVRGIQKECLKKMAAFIKEYKEYSKTIIFEATKYYIAINKKDNFKYIKRANYFISKDGDSVLASLCEEIKEAGKSIKTNINDINKTQKGSEDF